MECFIRINHMTINEDTEIYEVVSYTTGNVVWWGSADKLTKILGNSAWKPGDTIIWKA